MHESPVGVIVLIPSLLTPTQTEQQANRATSPNSPLDSSAPLNQSSDEAVAAAAAAAVAVASHIPGFMACQRNGSRGESFSRFVR